MNRSPTNAGDVCVRLDFHQIGRGIGGYQGCSPALNTTDVYCTHVTHSMHKSDSPGKFHPKSTIFLLTFAFGGTHAAKLGKMRQGSFFPASVGFVPIDSIETNESKWVLHGDPLASTGEQSFISAFI